MSNPNNAVGTNGAFGGRTSVNALNDVLATFTGSGVLSGWAIEPKSGMSVEVGGASGLRDVAVAQDNNGNRTTIDNISQSPIQVDMASAPSTGSRIDAIVGYVENPPQGSATVIDNPSACGVMAVSGTASSSPSAPTESAIRTALTAAGINGATAYIAVLGYVTIPAGTTDIDASMIGGAQYTSLDIANQIPDGGISANKVDFATIYATLNSNVNIQSPATSGTFNLISLDNVANSIGDDFTLENGRIRCNFNGKCLVLGVLYELTSTGDGLTNCYVFKNNSILVSRYNIYKNQSYVHCGPAMAVVNCSAGDTISLHGRFQSQTNVSVGSQLDGTKLIATRIS